MVPIQCPGALNEKEGSWTRIYLVNGYGERQWEFEYVDRHASGDPVPKTSQALIKALRESGFVK